VLVDSSRNPPADGQARSVETEQYGGGADGSAAFYLDVFAGPSIGFRNEPNIAAAPSRPAPPPPT
jgi:hypothetical protein